MNATSDSKKRGTDKGSKYSSKNPGNTFSSSGAGTVTTGLDGNGYNDNGMDEQPHESEDEEESESFKKNNDPTN